MFSLYENLLSDNARTKWHKIVASQVEADQRANLNGINHVKARKKLMAAFEDCITFHLLTVFPEDTAE